VPRAAGAGAEGSEHALELLADEDDAVAIADKRFVHASEGAADEGAEAAELTVQHGADAWPIEVLDPSHERNAGLLAGSAELVLGERSSAAGKDDVGLEISHDPAADPDVTKVVPRAPNGRVLFVGAVDGRTLNSQIDGVVS